jgi:hypothetical protein
VPNQNLIQEEIKRRLNLGNDCYHSVQYLLFSYLLLKNIQNYNFACILYGCGTWSLTVRKEHRLMMCENRILRRIFGLKRDVVIGGLRNLHNEELHNLYSSPSVIRMIQTRRMRWAGHVALLGKKRNAYRILVGKPEGKRPLGRP